MIGGCRTDKDKGPGKEMARVYNGHRGIIGSARERERVTDRERAKRQRQDWAAAGRRFQ